MGASLVCSGGSVDVGVSRLQWPCAHGYTYSGANSPSNASTYSGTNSPSTAAH